MILSNEGDNKEALNDTEINGATVTRNNIKAYVKRDYNPN